MFRILLMRTHETRYFSVAAGMWVYSFNRDVEIESEEELSKYLMVAMELCAIIDNTNIQAIFDGLNINETVSKTTMFLHNRSDKILVEEKLDGRWRSAYELTSSVFFDRIISELHDV